MENNISNTQPTQTPELAPNNNLTWAILSTILCCWPFGIPAIVNAAKVDKYWIAGYKEDAKKAANNAKKWANISAILAAIFWGLYFLLLVLSVGLS